MPSIRRGQGSTSFVDRALQTNRRRSAITDTPQPAPGGLGGPSPTGLGSQPQRPLNPPQGGQGDLVRTPARPAAPGAGGEPAPPEPQPRLLSIPKVDDEFPLADLVNATLTGQNVASTGLGERFYRRYGRYPTDVDLNIISMRRRFETEKGRPPTRDELLAYLRRGTVINRQDEFLG